MRENLNEDGHLKEKATCLLQIDWIVLRINEPLLAPKAGVQCGDLFERLSRGDIERLEPVFLSTGRLLTDKS